ncbi:MAG: 4-hydroxy-3-methylbut-2-enyl diphosphate reductase [Bacteroidetes bacterium]|nr:MAG: 4-hydroxy-3-methylbut-2-enyl diphosphate reductase [Bacteroidota bacterium]
MQVSIDVNSGFCFGVVNAIQAAEDYLKIHDELYCLGDIVHNNMEVNRLSKLGLVIINHEQFEKLNNVDVLIRAHGEPPETYRIALKNKINLLDASCPVVLRLQNNIRKGHQEINKTDGQVVIYGKQGHAEVVGLAGQTADEAIIISDENDLSKIDLSKPIELYSQTTKSIEGFNSLVENIKKNKDTDTVFNINDTICRQVSHRAPQLRGFSNLHDVIIFVSGKKSSNGKYLYSICYETNKRTYFISSPDEIDMQWFEEEDSVGICGATSTPRWLMDETKIFIEKMKI